MDRAASLTLLRSQPYRLYFTARTTSALSEAMMPVALAVAVPPGSAPAAMAVGCTVILAVPAVRRLPAAPVPDRDPEDIRQPVHTRRAD